MGKKPPDPLDKLDDEDNDGEQHFGDLDDEEEVPTTNMEPANVIEKEVTNHNIRTNDDIDANWWGEGDLNKIIEKDSEYLLSKKPLWQPTTSVDNDTDPMPTTMTKPVPKPKKDDKEAHCNLCYVSNQPVEVFLSHHTLAPECPSMTDQERRQLYGSQGTRRRKGHRS